MARARFWTCAGGGWLEAVEVRRPWAQYREAASTAVTARAPATYRGQRERCGRRWRRGLRPRDRCRGVSRDPACRGAGSRAGGPWPGGVGERLRPAARRHLRSRATDGLERLARVLEALVGVLLERPVEDLQHDRGHARGQLQRGARLLLHDLVQDRVHRLGLERLVPGQELVEDAAERERVGAGVGLRAAHLLGGHVVGRPHHEAGPGHVRPAEARQPEVHDLDLAVGQQVHVRGLEVPVHDVPGVGEREALGDLLHDVELLLDGQGVLRDRLLEVHALEQLHRHVGYALVLAELVDRDDVGVAQLARGLGLPLKALAQRTRRG